MTATRPVNRVAGFIHDVDRLSVLSTAPCNVLVVSDRTLYVLQNLAGLDVAFRTRYGYDFSGSRYTPVDEDSPYIGIVQDTINQVGDETMPCDLSDLITAITNGFASLTAQASLDCACSGSVGSDVDAGSGESGGSPPASFAGEPYTTASAIADRKCLAANYIHNGIRDVVTDLNLKRADTYGFAGIGFVLQLVGTVVGGIVAGPFGLLIGAVIGSLLAMATKLLQASFDLDALLTAILDDEDAAICALHDALSADDARDAYLAYLVAGGATSLETDFITYMLPNSLLNLLFFAWGDSEDAIENVTVTSDCSGCCVENGSLNLIRGTVTSGSFNTVGTNFAITSVDNGASEQEIYFEINQPSGCPCINYDILFVSITGGIGPDSHSGAIALCDLFYTWDNGDGYAALEGNSFGGASLFLRGDSSFTVTFSITEP